MKQEQLDSSRKCARCAGAIVDTDRVRRDHGEWYHADCARLMVFNGVRNEAPAILCVVCRTGISRLADLSMTDVGSMHLRCRPAESDPLSWACA